MTDLTAEKQSERAQPVSVPKTAKRPNQHTNPNPGKVFRLPMYDISSLTPETWEHPRPCWYCGCPFTPKRKNDWVQHFCSKDHKDTFYKYGVLPFDRIMLALRQEITKQIEAESFSRIVGLAQQEINRRTLQTERELYRRLRGVVASMILDPRKAKKELDAIATGALTQKDLNNSIQISENCGTVDPHAEESDNGPDRG